VASFDFPESRLLAEIYAAALRQYGVRATVIAGLGPREVVFPALQQGAVDVVPEYAGTAMSFIGATPPVAPSRDELRIALDAALAGTGLDALEPARARDSNGVVVTAARAERAGWKRISDLRPFAARQMFGGPPECRARQLCLRGLQQRYGLAFRGFTPIPSSAAMVDALRSGEIDVGLLDTTDPALLDGDLRLLTDDRHLQPPDNVTPIVREATLRRYGHSVTIPLDAVSRRLTTGALVALNRRLAGGADPAVLASAWLALRGGPASPSGTITP
jgi:osmoprotectant transport system substrate-binding protein